MYIMTHLVTEKFRYKASPFMEKKAVGGWRGNLRHIHETKRRKKIL